MKYSPIMERYLSIKKYKTKNLLKPMTMRLTPYDENLDHYEKKFKRQKHIIKKATKLSEKYDQLIKDNLLNKELDENIARIKKEAMEHNKMLEEKKKAEVEKGAYEYANYLVSMLNAGTSNYIIDR